MVRTRMCAGSSFVRMRMRCSVFVSSCSPTDASCRASLVALSFLPPVAVILRVLGEGTFGRVYLARHQRTSELVALKKVRIKRAEEGLPKVLMREIQALEKLGAEAGSRLSRHVVQLREHFAQGSAVVLALEYMVADLQQVLHALSFIGARMHMKAVRACMRMVLTGVAGVHAQKVMHRVSGGVRTCMGGACTTMPRAALSVPCAAGAFLTRLCFTIPAVRPDPLFVRSGSEALQPPLLPHGSSQTRRLRLGARAPAEPTAEPQPVTRGGHALVPQH